MLPLYLALLVYRLNDSEAEELINRLNLSKRLGKIIRDTLAIKAKESYFALKGTKASIIYQLLKGYTAEALTANLIAADNPDVRSSIRLFQARLRHARTSLTGTDLIALGVPPGPQIKKVLQELLSGRLNGEISSRAQEIELVKSLLSRTQD